MSGSNSPRGAGSQSMRGVSYESTRPGKPPLNITTAPRPSAARLAVHPSLRPQTSPTPSFDGSSARSKAVSDVQPRDSSYTVTTSTQRDSRTTIATDDTAPTSVRVSHSVRKSRSLPRIAAGHETSPTAVKAKRTWSGQKTIKEVRAVTPHDDAPKLPAVTLLAPPSASPAISFDDLTGPDTIEFSKRGSMLIKGRKASGMSSEPPPSPTPQKTSRPASLKPAPAAASTTSLAPSAPARVMSPDEESMSQRVRSMYESGPDSDSFCTPERSSMVREPAAPIEDEPSASRAKAPPFEPPLIRIPEGPEDKSELAGGLEDWRDVDSADVDRYGFIVPRRRAAAPNGSSTSLPAPDPRLHRVSTALQVAAEAPRRRRSRLGRTPSTTATPRRPSATSDASAPDPAAAATTAATTKRPLSSQSSYRTTASTASRRGFARMRSAHPHLARHRDRRLVDAAGDMLTLPPGLADIAEADEGGRAAARRQAREGSRDAKWRAMATVVPPPSSPGGGGGGGGGGGPAVGGGAYAFDPRHPKLARRAWKGIPDRWRATAWHSFLAASARARPGSASDADLVTAFDDLVARPAPDDVQIDLDVPRTVSGHVMFRRRYRGGQRLLFRVLHALGLYLPATGYVQGMAAPAATLLCYYEERMAFVMLVRLFTCRGLDRLYRPGFAGLMRALDELEAGWLRGTEVEAKLVRFPSFPVSRAACLLRVSKRGGSSARC